MTILRELRAIVVDDEPLARDELTFLLSECGGVTVVGQAKDAATALALAQDTQPDVAFVDLRMPGPDGISLAEALHARQPDTAVVVVSAHDDGALRAFDASVRDYLLKPVRLERLQRTVERLRVGRPSEAPLSRLAVKRKGAFVVVDVAQVLYFEMRDELVWAVTADDRFALDMTLSDLEGRVGEPFFRSHRSVLVRVTAIATIEPTGTGASELIIDHPDKPRLPLARERTRALRELIPVVG